MTKRMLVDATHPEETRVAIVNGTWLTDFDFERASRKQLKGNIYLAKVIRIEASLQAAFVEYGGNRHGFLPFSEIHPDYFRIPIADRPQDEELDQDDTEDDNQDASDQMAEQVAEYRAEAAMAAEHEAHHHEDLATAEGSPEGQPAEPPTPSTLTSAPHVSSETSHPTAPTSLSPLPPESENDLGLITDFGNALPPQSLMPEGMGADPSSLEGAAEITPLETVGGEMAEEERYRRPPRPRYKIQEVVKRRQVMLIQVVKEERGNKGAALTTFLSLAGRYCVLMPNTDHGGGVSRKITNHQDRRRMKEILDQLEIPEGMAVILRTAGMEQEPAEIQRDLEHLLRLWNNIREETLRSTAPTLIYEEANLIKRSLRDLYSNDLDEILVAGARGHQLAVDFMRTIMPDHLEKVKLYEDPVPLFFRYTVEKQIDQLYSPTVQLRSGGYIVINPTEALVSIDVNSGRATRERHIEGTALKTNLEAAEEIARQLRLRDLAGLVVIDFIDMEDGRNNAAVERRMKESMRADRARLQIGRISPFGLMELSRQRLHPSLMEINFEKCVHCAGIGLVRSVDSAALSILRMIEEEGIRQGAVELVVHIPTQIALYILNQKRAALSEVEHRYNMQVLLHSDDTLVAPDCRIEKVRTHADREHSPVIDAEQVLAQNESIAKGNSLSPPSEFSSTGSHSSSAEGSNGESRPNNRSRGRGRFGSNRNRQRTSTATANETSSSQPQAGYDQHPVAEARDTTAPDTDNIGNVTEAQTEGGNQDHQDGAARRGRRRGRRGGRGRRSAPPEGRNTPGGINASHQSYDHASKPRTENSWNTPHAATAVPLSTPTANYIPTSVHEIDTTPRDYSSHSRPSTQPASSHPYEVVDSSSEHDKPKGGWWRRLTGQ